MPDAQPGLVAAGQRGGLVLVLRPKRRALLAAARERERPHERVDGFPDRGRIELGGHGHLAHREGTGREAGWRLAAVAVAGVIRLRLAPRYAFTYPRVRQLI